MANPNHLKILKQGVEVWNRWRVERPGIEPDLSGARLAGMRLVGFLLKNTNLEDAVLCGANLTGTTLENSNLVNADLSCIQTDAKVDLSNLPRFCHSAKCIEGPPLVIGASFSSADLRGYSYTLAVLFRGAHALLCEIVFPVLRNAAKRNWKKCKDIIFGRGGSKSKEYDYIKLVNPEAGNRITKLHSEIHMTQVLGAGLLFGILVGSVSPFNRSQHELLYTTGLLLAGFASCAGMRFHLNKRKETALGNYAELLGFREGTVIAGILPKMSKDSDWEPPQEEVEN